MPGQAPPTGAARFFDRMRDGAVEAELAAGERIDRWFEIAGGTVLLRFAGPAMADFACRALSHLPGAPVADPDLTVHLWDAGSTGVAAPPRPDSFERFRGNGAIEGAGDDDGIRAAFVGGAEALSVFDPATATGVYWVRDVAAIREYDRPAPLRLLLSWWLETRRVTLVHGAAVGDDRGAALLAGRAGAGKSTTALACLGAGLDYVADDYCAVATAPDVVHSVYCTGKAVTANLSLLPAFTDLVPEADSRFEEKSIYYLGEHLPERIATSLPLRAVLVPEVVGGAGTRIEPASAAVALSALAPSTLFQIAHAGGTAFARLAELVRSVPCHRLLVGNDPATAAESIRELLAQ